MQLKWEREGTDIKKKELTAVVTVKIDKGEVSQDDLHIKLNLCLEEWWHQTLK